MAEAFTQALCPVCLRVLPARRKTTGPDTWLCRECPEHGAFRTLVWRGAPSPAAWDRPKLPYRGGPRRPGAGLGCPRDCGPCPAHEQRTCTALLEVTARCDLACPVCFASSRPAAGEDPPLARLVKRLELLRDQTGGCNLQLSGGEPTLRPDLPELVAAARRAGFAFVQLNTNGLALAADPGLASRLAGAGLASVFLQFDGLAPAGHLLLRGRELLAAKREAVARAAAAGLGVVLVPTVARGVNDGELWAVVAFALAHAPGVRGVHFQPLAYFGRHPGPPEPAGHFTLPELMTGLAAQSGGRIRPEDFAPPGCEHSLCSCHARYLVEPDGGLLALGGGKACGCGEPVPAIRGALAAIELGARQWAAPPPAAREAEAADPLARLAAGGRRHLFSLSAMAFQDAWTLDLARLKGCCIHVATLDDRLVPFCAYNLTARDGRPLHREAPCA